MDNEQLWEKFQDWLEYNGKYEGIGYSFDTQVDMFNDWLEQM